MVSDAVSAIHLMSDKENEKIEQKRTKHVNIANQGEEKAREVCCCCYDCFHIDI